SGLRPHGRAARASRAGGAGALGAGLRPARRGAGPLGARARPAAAAMSALEPGRHDLPGGGRGSEPVPPARAASGSVTPATVRPATAGDIQRVSEIEQDSFTDPWSRSAFERFVVEQDERVLFEVACLADGRVAGYVVAWFIMGEG